MLNAEQSLQPGFSDPVHDAHKTFRAVLHAMAHPGRILESIPGLTPPGGLQPATVAVGLSLFDLETPIWFDTTSATSAVTDFFRFHTGCPETTETRKAAFGIVSDPKTMPALDAFNCGSDVAPENSTTLIIEVAKFLQSGNGLTLSGPGIETTQSLLIDSLPETFWRQRVALQECFPRGLDMIFTAGHQLVALPRTTIATG